MLNGCIFDWKRGEIGGLPVRLESEGHGEGAVVGDEGFGEDLAGGGFGEGEVFEGEVVDFDAGFVGGAGEGVSFFGDEGVGFFEVLDGFRIGSGVVVTGDDDGVFSFGESSGEGGGLGEAEFFAGPVEMDGEEGDGFAIDVHLNFLCDAGFASGGEFVGEVFFDRESGEDAEAVFASVMIHEFSERGRHAEGFTDEGGLVGGVGTFAVLVDFLEGEEVGGLFFEVGDGAVEVEFVVHAATVFDVVGEELDGGRFFLLS